MLVQVLKSGPGCAFEEGQLLKMGDKQAQHFINQGFAVQVDEIVIAKPVEGPKVSRPLSRGSNPFMTPPRFLCGCGFVAKNENDLKEHQAGCD